MYIEYSKEEEAFTAYYAMMGRWYDGKQLYLEFITIPDWKMALCGKNKDIYIYIMFILILK